MDDEEIDDLLDTPRSQTIKYIPDIDDIKDKLDRIEVHARIVLHLVDDIRRDIKNGGFDKK